MSNSSITTELVKELRDATGISVMQCRKALEEAGGDMQKAIAILKKTSAAIAEKKKDREAKDGAVAVKAAPGKAVLVSLHCETDFVSKNEDFKNLLEKLTDMALKEGVNNLKDKTAELVNPVIQKTGEKIELGEAYEVVGEVIGYYVHNGKMAAIVSLRDGKSELAKDIAMHITAMQPEDIPELLNQTFIKNPDETVGDLLKKNKAEIVEIKKYSI